MPFHITLDHQTLGENLGTTYRMQKKHGESIFWVVEASILHLCAQFLSTNFLKLVAALCKASKCPRLSLGPMIFLRKMFPTIRLCGPPRAPQTQDQTVSQNSITETHTSHSKWTESPKRGRNLVRAPHEGAIKIPCLHQAPLT